MSPLLEDLLPPEEPQVNLEVLSFLSSLPSREAGRWQVGVSTTTPDPEVSLFKKSLLDSLLLVETQMKFKRRGFSIY